MKRIFTIIICFIFIIVGYNVEALEYKTNELIAVNSLATVDTERFLYKDFLFNINGNSANLSFTTIKNKSNSKEYITFNILMFDKDKKNIGFITYCSKKDYESSFANYEIASNQELAFNINISERYFVEGKSINDLSYIALFDENKYCQIGGYSKYQDLTIEQISSGNLADNVDYKNISIETIKLLINKGIIVMIVIIGILLIALIINGIILNALYKRMFTKTTKLAYIPFLNNYISVKLSFGDLPSKIFLGFLGLALILFLFKIGFLLTLVNIISFVSFIIVIIKLITKNYNLFYYEKLDNLNKNTVIEDKNKERVSFINHVQEDNMDKNNVSNEDIVDLSYENESQDTVFGNISVGSNMFNNNINQENNSEKDTDNNESDLSKFFR